MLVLEMGNHPHACRLVPWHVLEDSIEKGFAMETDNKEVVRNFFEAWSRRDVETAASLVAEDFVNNSSTSQGRDGVREEGEYWFTAFPDASVSIEDVIAEDDRVVVRLTARATHGGNFMGAEATGRQVVFQEIDIARVENGLIAEMWAAPDLYGMMAQLGLLGPEMAEESE
jgi:C-1 hydroxylase